MAQNEAAKTVEVLAEDVSVSKVQEKVGKSQILAAPSDVLTASPFHSVSLVVVKPDLDPNAGDVYPLDSDPNSRDPLLGLTRSFLNKVAAAAAATIVESTRLPDDEGKITYQARARMTLPDGSTTEAVGTYTLDIRPGGARYQEYYEDRVSRLVARWMRSHPKIVERRKYGASQEPWGEYMERVKWYLEENEPETWSEIQRLAKAATDKYINGLAKFATQRAATGAESAAIRKLLGIRQGYRLSQIRNGFVVVRSRFDMDRLAEAGMQEEARAMSIAMAAKAYGIQPEELTGILQQMRAQAALQAPDVEEEELDVEEEDLSAQVHDIEPDDEIVTSPNGEADVLSDPLAELLLSSEPPEEYMRDDPITEEQRAGIVRLVELAVGPDHREDAMRRIEAIMEAPLDQWAAYQYGQFVAAIYDYRDGKWQRNEEKTQAFRKALTSR